MNNLYILHGCPGSGKSYFAKHYIQKKDTVYVSRDDIRFSLLEDGEDYFGKESIVQDRFYTDIAKNLELGFDVIADATHINVPSIQKTLRNVERRMDTSTLDDYAITLVYFDTPLCVCLLRNAMREGRRHVPQKVIKDMYRKSPTPAQIHDDIPQIDYIWTIGEFYE